MELLSDDAPEFCEHRDNRFGEIFFIGVVDVLEDLNDELNSDISDGDTNYILHIFDSQDTSLRTSDADITIGICEGIPSEDWEEGPPLDFPFSVNTDHLDEHRLPTQYHSIPAEQSGGGQVFSTTLAIIDLFGLHDLFGTGRIFDFQMRMEFDTGQLSLPPRPPPVRHTVNTPEYHGLDEPDANPYKPQGVLYGAVRGDNFRSEPIPTNFVDSCCRWDETSYRECEGGIVTEECDSMADLYLGGCLFCLEGTATPIDDCSRMYDEYVTCYTIFASQPYDVDTDGDEINDAWSAAYAFEGKRVSLRQ